jgi:hypothetical protein
MCHENRFSVSGTEIFAWSYLRTLARFVAKGSTEQPAKTTPIMDQRSRWSLRELE